MIERNVSANKKEERTIRRSQHKQQQQRFLRVNERIRARQVRLIDNDGTQMGVVAIQEARRIAREKNLDLIEVAPNASPPVCKIMDYGKYRYEQGKREKSSQKRQKSAEVKIVRLRPGTDDHDLATKARQAEKFLRRGHKVQFNVFFKGREVTHPELARDQLDRILKALQAVATVERRPTLQGRQMTMLVTPRPDMPPPPKDLDLDEEDEEDEEDEDEELEDVEVLESEDLTLPEEPEVLEDVAGEAMEEAA